MSIDSHSYINKYHEIIFNEFYVKHKEFINSFHCELYERFERYCLEKGYSLIRNYYFNSYVGTAERYSEYIKYLCERHDINGEKLIGFCAIEDEIISKYWRKYLCAFHWHNYKDLRDINIQGKNLRDIEWYYKRYHDIFYTWDVIKKYVQFYLLDKELKKEYGT